jgi:hypothetical protein
MFVVVVSVAAGSGKANRHRERKEKGLSASSNHRTKIEYYTADLAANKVSFIVDVFRVDLSVAGGIRALQG